MIATEMLVTYALAAYFASIATATNDDLSLAISTDKEVYEFAEPIFLAVTVTNRGGNEYTIAETPFECPGRRLLEIDAPNGRRVSAVRGCGRWTIDDPIPTFLLDRGKTVTRRVNLMDHYPFLPGGPHTFDQAGTYQLRAMYSLDDRERRVEGIYAGPLESQTITFTVKPLEGVRLTQFIALLNSDDPKEKARILLLLRRGGRVDAIPDIWSLLALDQPEPVRREAALAMMDFPKENEWRRYALLLKDPDSGVRGAMALALANLRIKEAGDALYEATDPVEYSESYAAAFRALIQLSDPRVVEVAERLSKIAPSKDIRDWAARVAKGEDTKWP